jgi:hypothetical protein
VFFEVSGNFSSARASYFHKSIGGYHAANQEECSNYSIIKFLKNNMEVLNMLNVKYIIKQIKKERNSRL